MHNNDGAGLGIAEDIGSVSGLVDLAKSFKKKNGPDRWQP